MQMTSPAATRKERERKEREELILLHARRHLIEFGFQGFSLDDLAKSIEYSKGTIYLHFQSKEDLGLAVSTRSLTERAILFERAVLFKGTTRERASAIGFACCHFMISNPEHFNIEMMMTSHSFFEKASEARQKAHARTGARTFRAMAGVVHAGMESGDLPRGKVSPEQIAFAMASITVGTHIMSHIPEMDLMAGIHTSINIVRQNQDALLDGFGWQTLSSETDTHALDLRIRDEIFPEATWYE